MRDVSSLADAAGTAADTVERIRRRLGAVQEGSTTCGKSDRIVDAWAARLEARFGKGAGVGQISYRNDAGAQNSMQSGKNTISLDLPHEKALELAKTTAFLDGYARGVAAATEAMKMHLVQSLVAQKQQDDATSTFPRSEQSQLG